MKTKTAVLKGKPDAGNPHVRFDEGDVASAKPRRGPLLYKTVWSLLAAVAVMVLQALGGETFYLSADGNNQYALCDAKYWMLADGSRAAGGAGEPLGNEDTFIVRSGRVLRTANSNAASASQTFTGARLQIGDQTQSAGGNAIGTIFHYAGGSCVTDYGTKKLFLQYASYTFQNANGCVFSIRGDVTVEKSNANRPARFSSAYANQSVNWDGCLYGDTTAYLEIGTTSARTQTGDKGFRFSVLGESDYSGVVKVVAPATPSATAPDFRTILGVGGSVSGGIELAAAATTLAVAGRSLSVGALTVADGAQIEFGDRSGIVVTGSFSSAGAVEVAFPDPTKILVRDGTPHQFALLTVPSGTNLDKAAFRLADTALSTTFSFDVGKDAEHEYLYIVQQAIFANELQLTSDAHEKTLNVPDNALMNAYYWEDANGVRGPEHGALDQATAYCLRHNRWLRTPNSNDGSQSVSFGGGKLYVGDVLQSSDGERYGRIRHYSGQACVVDYGTDKLVLRYGDYEFRNGPRCKFVVEGDVQVDNTANYPAKIYNDVGNFNQVVCWTGDLKGGADSVLQLGTSSKRTVGEDEFFRFWLYGSATSYLGTINLVTDTDRSVAAGFRTEFGLGGDFGGKLNVAANTTLTSPSNAVSLARLDLAANSRLTVYGTREMHTMFTVTDAFAMAAPVTVAIGDPIALMATDGETLATVTVLSVPLGSDLRAEDFDLLLGEAAAFFEARVERTATAESLVLVQKTPVVKLVATDVVTKDHAVNGVVPPSAFETAESWSDGKLPHAGAHYYAGSDVVASGWAMIRSPQTPDYEFPGESLTVGRNVFLLQCANGLRFKKLQMLDGSCLHLEQGVASPAGLSGDELRFDSGTVYLSPYNAKEWQLFPKITGEAEIYFRGICGGTSRPDGCLSIRGSMEEFRGTFRFGSKELLNGAALTLQYPNIHYFNGTNFCAALPAFDYKSYVLSKNGLVMPRSVNMTLSAASNRGLLVEGEGTIRCDNLAYGTFEIDWPLTMDGTLTKEGPGTLAFGGAAAQFIGTDGARGFSPAAGKNVLNVSAGTLRVASADALNGVAVVAAEGAALAVAPKAGDDVMLRYGWRNTRTDAPFSTVGQKLALDLSAFEIPTDGRDFTVGLVTVSAAAENIAKDLLPGNTLRVPGVKGYLGKLVRLVDDETGDVTFAYEFSRQGAVLIVR